MNVTLPQCTRCKAPLGESQFNRDELVPCPVCAAPLQVEIFPALFRPLAHGRDGEALMVETESSCFYHPQKKALRSCQACGRFLCALCDCELNGEHFCPACLEVGRKKGKIKSLENQRTLYDSIAFALALYPLIFFYLTFVTAPMALYLALRRWNAPRSIVHRTRIRLVLAIVLSVAQIAGWCVGIYVLANRHRSHG